MENYTEKLLTKLEKFISKNFGMTLYGDIMQQIEDMQGRAGDSDIDDASFEMKVDPIFETILMHLAGVSSPEMKCSTSVDEEHDHFIFEVTGISDEDVKTLNRYFNIVKTNTDPTQFVVNAEFLYKERYAAFEKEVMRQCLESPEEIVPCLNTRGLYTALGLYTCAMLETLEDTEFESKMDGVLHHFLQIYVEGEHAADVDTVCRAMVNEMHKIQASVESLLEVVPHQEKYRNPYKDSHEDYSHMQMLIKLLDVKLNPTLAVKANTSPSKGVGLFDNTPQVPEVNPTLPQSSYRPGYSGCQE